MKLSRLMLKPKKPVKEKSLPKSKLKKPSVSKSSRNSRLSKKEELLKLNILKTLDSNFTRKKLRNRLDREKEKKPIRERKSSKNYLKLRCIKRD